MFRNLLFLFVCLIAQISFAQTQVVGVVKDNSGAGLPGVTILIKGTNSGTVSGFDGSFSLRAAENPTLVFSFIGYKTIEVKNVNGMLDITLEEASTELGSIEIVGSRNVNRSSTQSIAPVDVIQIRDVTSKVGQLDLNQMLQFAAPSFNSNRQSGSDGTDHIDPASLRGLGPDQTLVLINGKRQHPSSLVNIYGSRGRGNTGTDLNTIPAAAIDRIEILRDGASAQYGSDAIAGVINIVLKQKTDELAVNLNGGAALAKYRFDDKKFDGGAYGVNANYGFNIGQGFVNITADHSYRGFTNRANTNPDDLARRQFGEPQITNSSLYVNVGIPITQKVYFYSFGGYNHRNGNAYAWTRFADDDRNIPSIYPNGFDPLIKSNINDLSVANGVKVKLGKWDWDLSNMCGYNKFIYTVDKTLNTSLGAVSPTSFKAGGFKLLQDVINLSTSRNIPTVLKGLNLAFGGEYKYEQYNIYAGDENSWKSYEAGVPGGSQGFPGFQPGDETNKNRSNLAVYADAELDVTKNLVFGGALRYENFSDFGGTLNGKIAGRLELFKGLAVRATYSTGFRAPSLPQIYFNSTITNFVAGQPVEVLIASNDNPITKQLGIDKLKQETSQNTSAGFVFNHYPFTITADAYMVDVKDRIVLTGQFTDDDPDIGTILQSLNVGRAQFFTNALDTRTRGIDFVFGHRATIGNGVLNTSLAANFNEIEILKVSTNAKLAGKEDTYFDLRERYFLEASAPKSKIGLSLDYSVNKFTIFTRFTRFSKVVLANWNYDENDLDTYDARIVTDLSLGFRATKNVSITVGGNNIFNLYPTIHEPSLTESGGAWDPVQMGFGGTFLFARVGITL